MATNFDYVWRLKKCLPHRKGEACRILSQGRTARILVEFADGARVTANISAVRRMNS